MLAKMSQVGYPTLLEANAMACNRVPGPRPARGNRMKEGIRSIQFLRFIAATLVVLSHSMLAANDFFDGGVSRATLYFANVGGSGVHIFFVISGFIMVFTSFGREKNVFHSD